MRILQVFNRYRFRGGEEAWVDGLSSLLRNHATVTELRFESTDWEGPGFFGKLQQIKWIGNNPNSRMMLREKIASERPDILLFHNVIPVGSLGLYDEAKLHGIPVIQYTHNFRPFSPNGTLWLKNHVDRSALDGDVWPEIIAGSWQNSSLKTAVLSWHLRRSLSNGLLNKVSHWLAISDFMRDRFIEAGISSEKISTLRHCSSSAHDPFSQNPRDAHYLFLGRLVEEKGIHVLIKAWRILNAKLGHRCPLLKIAGSSENQSALEASCIDLPNIEFVGFSSGEMKEDLLRNCRALLAPSVWWEPLGLIVYEAYEHRKPVIAAAAGGLKETVIHSVTGWLHEPGNAEDLANAVIKSEEIGEEGRLAMGSSGLEWLQKNADPTIWRSTFLSLCAQLSHQ